jgi:hypothetical protein
MTLSRGKRLVSAGAEASAATGWTTLLRSQQKSYGSGATPFRLYDAGEPKWRNW